MFYGLGLPCTILSVCVLLPNETPEARASQGKEVYLVSSLEAETPKTESANWHRLSQRSMWLHLPVACSIKVGGMGDRKPQQWRGPISWLCSGLHPLELPLPLKTTTVGSSLGHGNHYVKSHPKQGKYQPQNTDPSVQTGLSYFLTFPGVLIAIWALVGTSWRGTGKMRRARGPGGLLQRSFSWMWQGCCVHKLPTSIAACQDLHNNTPTNIPVWVG